MDLGADDVTVVGLAHDQVSVGVGSDLGQVGDDDDLAVPGELRQASPDKRGGAATDTRASISSKTKVGGPGTACAMATSMASMIRESSPPEADRAMERSTPPACDRRPISTSSAPAGPARAAGRTSTATTVWASRAGPVQR